MSVVKIWKKKQANQALPGVYLDVQKPPWGHPQSPPSRYCTIPPAPPPLPPPFPFLLNAAFTSSKVMWCQSHCSAAVKCMELTFNSCDPHQLMSSADPHQLMSSADPHQLMSSADPHQLTFSSSFSAVIQPTASLNVSTDIHPMCLSWHSTSDYQLTFNFPYQLDDSTRLSSWHWTPF